MTNKEIVEAYMLGSNTVTLVLAVSDNGMAIDKAQEIGASAVVMGAMLSALRDFDGDAVDQLVAAGRKIKAAMSELE